jgi:hypothetical protein
MAESLIVGGSIRKLHYKFYALLKKMRILRKLKVL